MGSKTGPNTCSGRLLNQAVEHRGYAEGSFPLSSRFGDLHVANCFGPVGSGEQLCFDFEPMGFEVRAQLLPAHAIDSGGSFIAFYRVEGAPHVVGFDDCRHRRRFLGRVCRSVDRNVR